VSAESKTLDVAIIGAGFSGLYMLHRLRDKLGFDVRLFEAGSGVGGTWFWNRYPGARCDSESYYYSYSFDQALEQEWVWSSKYPEQPEIMRYLNHVADRFALRPDIQLDTRITSATFDEAADRWRLTTENGQSIDARFVVAATGCLSSRNVPSFEGLDQFQGEWYHTGAWPHEGVDFTGKRVGLIGTGSTGIQATPVIAAQSRTLTIFQRTPNYSVPARNAPLSPKERAEIKADVGGFAFLKVVSTIGSEALATRLIDEHGVLLGPGAYFGAEHYFRLGYSVPHLAGGLERLSVGLHALAPELVPAHNGSLRHVR
jgi:cation diffusion facilitator CzcD-associated flavoprotein CzcO